MEGEFWINVLTVATFARSWIGNITQGRLSNVVEAQSGFGVHGAMGGHPHPGGSTGVGYHEVVGYKVELMFLLVVYRVHLHVVPICQSVAGCTCLSLLQSQAGWRS